MKIKTIVIVLCTILAHIKSLIVPEQVALTYGATPSQMIATWVISTNGWYYGTTDSFVYYGVNANQLSYRVKATFSTYTINGYTSPLLFNAMMSNLVVGNVLYYYQVGSDTQGFSPIYHFKSHPGKQVQFNICYYAPSQPRSFSIHKYIRDWHK